ncbi:MAG: T9SS type A sorting domain-containing protein [Niastella sp.]|nr:T9SS type A sorting domain-containing protein [Niastella sp.]
MANRKFTLGKNVLTCMLFLYCLVIITSFTGNNRSKHVENDQLFFIINKTVQQPKAMMLFGPTDDRDGDGVLDGVDVDDDNDGITDLQESPTGLDPFGNDNGVGALNYQDNTMPGWVDVNFDGIDDRYDMDRDGIINSYDHDTDGDGIPDVLEAGFIDANADGQIDGLTTAPNGLRTTVPVGFTPPNHDTDPLPDFRDIDSDGDGITDNVEGQFTHYYVLPSGLDFDQDGIDNSYDKDSNPFCTTQGIVPVNFQGAVDVLADYIDTDTDDDGRPDLIEGHDANLDGVADFTPTGLDTDGDGLDNVFDLDNSGPNVRNAGMNQIPTPPFFDSNPPANPPGILGCRGPLQKSIASDLDRTWRTVNSTLPLTLVRFTAERQDGSILLNWESENEVNFREYVLERSKDGLNFAAVATIPGKGGLQALYAYTDNLSAQTGSKLYYRLKQVDNNERFVYSRILAITTQKIVGMSLNMAPNPSSGNVNISIASDKKRNITINVFDNIGRLLITQRTGVGAGDNIVPLSRANTLQGGTYTVIINDGELKLSQKLLIQK